MRRPRDPRARATHPNPHLTRPPPPPPRRALKGIVTVVAVDADAHKSLAGKYGVQGFPTIKFFGENKGAPTTYEGARDAAGIVDFAVKQAASVAKARLSGKAGGAKAGGEKKGAGGGAPPKGGKKPAGGGDAGAPGGGKAVVTLTPDNFDELVLNSAEPWLVEFYAPWCGHCKNLAPEWAAAAEETEGSGVKFGAVDADAHKSLGARFGVKGFPTIKTFPAGATKDADAKDYNGGRSASELAAAAGRLAAAGGAPAKVVEVTSPAAFAEACAKRVCLLAVLPHILDDGAAKRAARVAILAEVAGAARGKPLRVGWFEVGAHPKLEAALGVGMTPAVVALAREKGVFTPFLGALEAKALGNFAASLTSARGPAGAAKLAPGFDLDAALETRAPWDGKDGVAPKVRAERNLRRASCARKRDPNKPPYTNLARAPLTNRRSRSTPTTRLQRRPAVRTSARRRRPTSERAAL